MSGLFVLLSLGSTDWFWLAPQSDSSLFAPSIGWRFSSSSTGEVVAARGRHLLPLQLGRHGLTVDHLDVTDEAVGAVIRGYTREAGVWGLATALGDLCAKVVRRRAEGDTTPVEVTPEIVVEMLGAPKRDADLAGRTGRVVRRGEPMPGDGALTLTGRPGESMQESARTAMSWLRANASRYGLDPSFHRDN